MDGKLLAIGNIKMVYYILFFRFCEFILRLFSVEVYCF